MSNLELASNPTTPSEKLHLLAQDDDFWVRYWAARNPNTSSKTLELLAQDNYRVIRYWAAKNPNATELIRRLCLMKKNEKN